MKKSTVTNSVTDFARKLNMSAPKEESTLHPYTPAKLHDRDGDVTKQWMIEFYVYDHKTGKEERKQSRVPKKLGARERRKWANKKIEVINRLLAMGYTLNAPKGKNTRKRNSPDSYEGQEKKQYTVKEAFDYIHSIIKKELRKETLKTYGTCFRGFLAYAEENKFVKQPVTSLTTVQTFGYLDSLTLRGLSGYTYNSHLSMLRSTAGRMRERGIIEKDFTEGISKREVEAGIGLIYWINKAHAKSQADL